MSSICEKTQNLNIDNFANQMSLVWDDVEFFINQINKYSNGHARINVADIGSCNGDMSRFIRKYINKNIYTYNVEISEQLNKVAQDRDNKTGLTQNVEYIIGDALKLPFKQSSMDILIFSRIFHEIFSYKSNTNKNGFSNTSVFDALREAKRCLKNNGLVIIQDPARPPKYDTKVCMQNFLHKKALNVNELLNVDVSKLGTEDLLRRFLIEFKPVYGKYEITPNGYIFDKWVASEFIRHRKFNDSQAHWDKEICELYGPLSIGDYKYMAKVLGFKVKYAQYIRFPKARNFYAINNEFDIEQNGKKLVQYRSFPISMYIVLQK